MAGAQVAAEICVVVGLEIDHVLVQHVKGGQAAREEGRFPVHRIAEVANLVVRLVLTRDPVGAQDSPVGLLVLPAQAGGQERMNDIEAEGCPDRQHFAPDRVDWFQPVSQPGVDCLVNVLSQVDRLLPGRVVDPVLEIERQVENGKPQHPVVRAEAGYRVRHGVLNSGGCQRSGSECKQGSGT